MSAAVVVTAAWTAVGCATVSSHPSTAPVPGASASRAAPDRVPPVASPARVVTATARPAGDGTARPAPGHRAGTASPHSYPRTGREPYFGTAPAGRAAALPGGTAVCGLSEAFGGRLAGSTAARICRQAVRSAARGAGGGPAAGTSGPGGGALPSFSGR